MARSHTSYTCTSCAYQSVKWLGCCPSCNEWNTLNEIRKAPSSHQLGAHKAAPPTQMVSLAHVEVLPHKRMLSGINEWDRVVGGGIMPGSLVVLTGDPGIGKSTLLLQVSNALAQKYRVFYFSTEESLEQVKLRAQRIGNTNENLFFSDHAYLQEILATAEQERPDLLIVDSIQNCILTNSQASPGSVSQLRESTFLLTRLAKEKGITTIITGHITKEGVIAGPKTLEHMVDAVFYLRGEDRWHSRVLRAVKNRFGTVNELGFFEMQHNGMQEIANINEHLLSEVSHSPGSVLISTLEGSRPLMLELQALTIESKMTIPQRVISGVDHKQVVLIAAILQKYLQVKLSTHDIFFKVSGDFKVKGSSADLGIALALLSSYFQQPLPEQSIALGEIGLTGTIKPVNQIDIFAKEIEKFGIKHLMIAEGQKISRPPCTITRFFNVYQLLSVFEQDT